MRPEYVVFSKVPFAILGLWKHSFAKAAKLWVKLHDSATVKNAPDWLRGAANPGRRYYSTNWMVSQCARGVNFQSFFLAGNYQYTKPPNGAISHAVEELLLGAQKPLRSPSEVFVRLLSPRDTLIFVRPASRRQSYTEAIPL